MYMHWARSEKSKQLTFYKGQSIMFYKDTTLLSREVVDIEYFNMLSGASWSLPLMYMEISQVFHVGLCAGRKRSEKLFEIAIVPERREIFACSVQIEEKLTLTDVVFHAVEQNVPLFEPEGIRTLDRGRWLGPYWAQSNIHSTRMETAQLSWKVNTYVAETIICACEVSREVRKIRKWRRARSAIEGRESF